MGCKVNVRYIDRQCYGDPAHGIGDHLAPQLQGTATAGNQQMQDCILKACNQLTHLLYTSSV